MRIEDIINLTNSDEQVSALYDLFDEDQRLIRSKSAQVEFLVTIHYLEQVLKPNMRILDLGAGTGIYSLYLAEKGYSVTAVELAKKNYEIFQSKIKPTHDITLYHGSALDLSNLNTQSFDIVLLFGPLYHLNEKEDRDLCLQEALRVLKDDGTIFISFINHDIIHLSEISNKNYSFFNTEEYNHETMRLKNFPFVFFNIEECREMLLSNHIHIEKEIASDGLTELIQHKIDEMDDYSSQQYLKYHFLFCEKKELLSATNHFLFQGRKQ